MLDTRPQWLELEEDIVIDGRLACLVAVAAIQSLSTGCMVRTAAPTKLDIFAENRDDVRIGLKSSAWTVREGAFEMLAYGAHPREHETYAFIANEGYPAFVPRMIHLAGPSDTTEQMTFQIEILLSPILLGEARTAADGERMILFVGAAQLKTTTWFRERRVRLKNVTLHSAGNPEQVLQVSGEVVAKSNSQTEFLQLASRWTHWRE